MPKLSLKPFHVFHVVSRTAWMMWDGYFVSNRSLWGVVLGMMEDEKITILGNFY